MAKQRSLMDEIRSRIGSGTSTASYQAVADRRKRLQAKVAMNNDIANLVIARSLGMRIEQFERDQSILQQVSVAERQLRAGDVKPTGRPKQPQVKRKTAAPAGAAPRSVDVYPLLYEFENSVRSVVDLRLAETYGKDWFNDPKIVAKGIKATVERNRNAEGKKRYHSRRNARPVYYTNLGDLSSIIHSENGWKVFGDVLPNDHWFKTLCDEIESTRNIVAHMNPISDRDLRRVKGFIQDWRDQLDS